MVLVRLSYRPLATCSLLDGKIQQWYVPELSVLILASVSQRKVIWRLPEIGLTFITPNLLSNALKVK